jgi:transposase
MARIEKKPKRHPSDLTEAEWAAAAPLPPPPARNGRMRSADLREIVVRDHH